MQIDPELASRVSLQKYGAERRIHGVEFHELSRFVDDAGSLQELARLDAGAFRGRPGFQLRQINHALLEPGSIKAFHLHLRQSELWFAPPDTRLLVGLLDVRADSPTTRQSMRFVMGDGASRLLFIPAGVAHGVANLSARAGSLVYFTDQEFTPDPARCDEQRLAWDTLGASFWERERG